MVKISSTKSYFGLHLTLIIVDGLRKLCNYNMGRTKYGIKFIIRRKEVALAKIKSLKVPAYIYL